MLGQRVHLATRVLGILGGHVEASSRGSVWNLLLAIARVVLVCPLRSVDPRDGVMCLVVRSGSRDRWSLGLGAETCKQVRTAGAWSWVVGRILANGSNTGRESHAQPLGVLTLASCAAEARTRKTKTI